MKKFFSILAAVLFAGSMMADSYTVTFKDAGEGKSDGSSILTSSNVADYVAEGAEYFSTVEASGNVYLGQGGYGLKFGNKSNPGSITLTLATPVTPTSIVMNASPWSGTEGSGLLQDSIFATKSTGAKGTFGDFTYYYDGATQINTIVVGTSTKRGYVKSITINYEAGAAPAVSTPVITGNASFYETAEISIACSTEGANVYYTLDGAEPTAESALYAAPFEINATTTVKAIAIKGEDKSAVAEKTFTKATVLTVAQALDLDLSTPVENQYVKGIVSRVESFNSNYGSITYWISDNGEQANELEVYGGLAMNGAKFEAQDNLAVGDKVVVFGTLKDFKGTKEFDKNNYLVAFERADIVVTNCDWENIEWLGDGSPEQTFGNQFKVCKDGEQPGVVNIQKPGWAAETGIYLTFPSAAFGEISLPENKYVKEGAGILFYLSAFTAKETEVSVICESNEIIFTVYNDKGTDKATALINTKPEVKAVKTVINGQVVIIRDGKMINVLGVQL